MRSWSSPMEHPAGLATVLRMSARFGVRIVQWGVPVERAATADEVVEAFRKRVRPGVTRAIFFSSPLWPNGQRLPERRIAALAQEAGAITVADGAHYGGMIEPRLDESGIDFWAISGHKWQCGPGRHRHSVYPQPPASGQPHAAAALSHHPQLRPRYPVRWQPPRRFRHRRRDEPIRLPGVGRLARAGRCLRVVGRGRTGAHPGLDPQPGGLSSQPHRGHVRRRCAAAADHRCAAQVRHRLLQSFPQRRQRGNPELNIEFRERLLRDYGFRISGGGVGPDGFTRAPDPEAAAFPTGLVPNRDPDTLTPKPFGYPLRVNACVWNTVVQMDRFVAASQDLVRKMTA